MHVVTFYSFKGGVGRTLALANAACELAKRGRRVLVVDFDLEAPGLPTLPVFACGYGKPGIVEFVEEYRRTKIAPDVREFLSRCPTTLSGDLWFMSAGRSDGMYASRLSSIDWRRLYDEEDGYLLFEDLKAQWSTFIRPDYVLIDSRTGHTDVAGVCTRHLADAVVALFLPNAQNILGLGRVASEIRSEKRPRKHKLGFYFVASNVPGLDDENEILSRQMAEARKVLGFEKVSVVHHYDALALLEQSVFVLDRPNTRLAREYIDLVDVIVRGNLSDRDGALGFLRELTSKQGREVVNADAEFEEIAGRHSKDGEVLGELGRAYESRGDYASAVPFFTAAIESGHDNAEIRVRRATAFRVRGELARASDDFRRVTEIPGVDDSSFFRAIVALAEIEPDWLKEFAPARRIPFALLSKVVQVLMTRRATLPIAERFLRANNEEEDRPGATTLLVLCLMAQRRFAEALSLIETAPTPNHRIADEFNAAMCLWGTTGTIPTGRLESVLALHAKSERTGANYFQCMALTAIALGRGDMAKEFLLEARRGIRRLPRKTFSSWRYLEVDVDEFVHDLDEIENFRGESRCLPRFMSDDSQQDELFKPAERS